MLETLSWLPSPPSDFRTRRTALRRRLAKDGSPDGLWDELKALVGYALDEAQLGQVAALVEDLGDRADVPRALSIAVVGDGTLSLLGRPLAASALRRDLRLSVVPTEYGMAMNDATNPGSEVHRLRPDFVLIACDRRMLGLDRTLPTKAEAEERVEAAFQTIRTLAERFRPSAQRAVLVQTVPPPLDPLFGSFDVQGLASPYGQVTALNDRLVRWASESGAVIVDAARLASSVGLDRWEDPVQWHNSKLPFAFGLIPLYADFVARTLGAIMGKSRKCLVLDLDNTLWGGVIGDDGLAGIVLGQGSALGEAYVAIQQMALDLRRRGVILAISSKNEDDAARSPFRRHSEMVLKEEHIAAFHANWIDKAANLKVIAETLNIGLDSLVFLDDNPAEREQVRRELPAVAVPELPASAALYPRALMAAGYFDAVAFGDEDRGRADQYLANQHRQALQASATDLEGYHRSLQMVCTITPFNAEGRSRIAQLTNKSNQFNLTTRRYSEQEIAQVEADPAQHAIQVQLSDTFGNNGMISVVIAHKQPREWIIDTWLMSCRVLGRRIEEAVLAHLADAAAKASAERLVGKYIPTGKNRMVEEHYAKLGFVRAEDRTGKGAFWVLPLDLYAPPSLPMTIVQG